MMTMVAQVVCEPYKHTSSKNNVELQKLIECLRLEGRAWQEADRRLKTTESMN